MNNPLFDFDTDASVDTYNDLYQEFVSLREKVENTHNCLQSQIIEITNKTKRVYNKKEVLPEEQAILLHYEENKDSMEVLNNIQTNLMKMGYEVYPHKGIPKFLRKLECLKQFNALTTEEKQKYY